MDNHSKWFAIINPEAGSGKGNSDWPIIKKTLIENDISFDYQKTERKYHAVEITVSAIKGGYRKILVIGGDGTLNEVVNGVFLQKNIPTTEITIGVIGVGTGNDWQRLYAYPSSYSGKVESIKAQNTVLQDVGSVGFFESKIYHNMYFANVAGIGFDAEVALTTNRLKESGYKWKLIYIIALLISLIKFKTPTIGVSINNQKYGGKIFSITLGIGKYSGGGMLQVPNALPDDGLFDVTIIRKMRKLSVIRNLYRLYNGSILNHPKISGHQGTTITISAKPAANLEIDGESRGTSPFSFTIIPKSIRVVVGADFKSIPSPMTEIYR